jgi:hypothetical protein
LFVQPPPAPADSRKLGLSRTFRSSRSGPTGQIGFVSPKSFACTFHHISLPIKDLPVASRRGQLGLFRTFDPRQIGFVCTTGYRLRTVGHCLLLCLTRQPLVFLHLRDPSAAFSRNQNLSSRQDAKGAKKTRTKRAPDLGDPVRYAQGRLWRRCARHGSLFLSPGVSVPSAVPNQKEGLGGVSFVRRNISSRPPPRAAVPLL